MAIKPTPRRKHVIRPVTTALILKATSDSDPVAVFSSSGRLLGIVDPSKITPVSDPDADANEKLPKPTRSDQTEAAAGESPQMGLQKRRAAALQQKAGLYGGGVAAEKDQLARDMSEAASRVLKEIHGQARVRRR